MAGKDLLTRLADAGEEAIGRLAHAPGADQVMGVANSMRDRMDEMQKRIRGLDALETRVADLERRLDAAEGRTSRPRRAAAKPAVKKTPAAARGTGSSTTKSASARKTAKKPAAKRRTTSTGRAGGSSPG
ncbi:MAG: hypothetical protein ACRDN6_07170 [Gaiellaceae bacterium]